MKRLDNSRGMTLTEVLCTTLILLLISAMLAVGIRFGVQTYRDSMALSEAQVLCSTLTTAISDKLRYSGGVEDNMFIQGVGSTGSGGGFFALNEDGEVVIRTTKNAGTQTEDKKEDKLLGSASYPRGLKVIIPNRADEDSSQMVRYDKDRGIFTVAFAIADAEGKTLKETSFDVKRVNYIKTG